MRRLTLGLRAFVPLALAAVPLTTPVPAFARDALARSELTIVSGRKQHRFKVEVARTSAEQARGLMYRKALAPNEGMIFPMRPPRFASFWMKNTVIPLDLLFVRADGTVSSIAARARPLDLSPIESIEPVAAVLEIAGGRAAQLGLKPGDRIVSPALRP